MTCIAAVTDGKTVWMGGDSASVSGLDLTIEYNPKVFLRGEFLIGYTSSFRMGQLLQYAFTPPAMHDCDLEAVGLHGFMVTQFVNAVRECLKAGGYARKNNEEESAGTFLVGVRGHLFRIDADYQVGESAHHYDDYLSHRYDAVGCGEPYALGAFAGMSIWDPEVSRSGHDRLHVALAAAATHSGGVREPFTILSTPPADAQFFPFPRTEPER